mgnify:CR=1 FL=1
MLAEANDKLKRKEAIFTAPVKKQANEAWFGAPPLPALCVKKVQDRAAAPSNGAVGLPQQKRAPEGGMARWLARSAVQGCAV